MHAPLVVDLGPEICGSLETAAEREWLVTNGLGGFASGTVAGLLTRRYHGLLVAALDSPQSRALLVSKPNWFGYVVLEGEAQLLSPENTQPDELRMALRDVYRGASGGDEHSDWDEYDEAMVTERRSLVLIEPSRVFEAAG